MEYRRGWRAFIRESSTRGLQDVDRQALLRIWSHVRPHRGQLVMVALAVLCQSLIGLLPPLFFRHFIDNVLPALDTAALIRYAGLLLLLPFVNVGVGLVQQVFATRLGETLVFDLRNTMYAHVQRLSLRFFTDTRSGEIVARFTQDVEGARRMVTGTLPQLMNAVVTLTSTLVVMVQLEWRLTVPGVLLFPLLWPFAYWMAKIMRRTHHLGMEHNARLSGLVSENLNINGAALTKLFGQEDYTRGQFQRVAELVRQFRTRLGILSYGLTSGMGILSGVGTALFYGLGGWLVLAGEMTAGTIVAFVAYLPRLYQPISAVSHVQVEVVQGIVSFERVFAYLDEPMEIQERPRAITLAEPEGHLEFERVSFDYGRDPFTRAHMNGTRPGPDHGPLPAEVGERGTGSPGWALRDVSFTVGPGQMMALVGLSGAGKSTLINLVMRLYDPTAGRILLDGRDLRDLTLDSLSGCMGMVTQDAYLFHDTLRANLLFARPSATEDELQAACAAAQIREFVDALPQGLETIVGERGHRLSGGEKQRVSLARVLLKNPRIFILDEATSHLDSQSEFLIQSALEPLLARCTSIVIAHRLSTVRNADSILVMDRGAVVEWGRHEELLQRNGLYSHLHALQFQSRPEPLASTRRATV